MLIRDYLVVELSTNDFDIDRPPIINYKLGEITVYFTLGDSKEVRILTIDLFNVINFSYNKKAE